MRQGIKVDSVIDKSQEEPCGKCHAEDMPTEAKVYTEWLHMISVVRGYNILFPELLIVIGLGML